jgi:hypothetical protein
MQLWRAREPMVPSPTSSMPTVLGVKGIALRARRLRRGFASRDCEVPPAGLSYPLQEAPTGVDGA